MVDYRLTSSGGVDGENLDTLQVLSDEGAVIGRAVKTNKNGVEEWEPDDNLKKRFGLGDSYVNVGAVSEAVDTSQGFFKWRTVGKYKWDDTRKVIVNTETGEVVVRSTETPRNTVGYGNMFGKAAKPKF